MPPDLSEFEALTQQFSTHGRQCPIRAVLDKLSKVDKEQLIAALAHDQSVITNRAITAWLERRQQKINWQTVSVHRRDMCNCAPRT